MFDSAHQRSSRFYAIYKGFNYVFVGLSNDNEIIENLKYYQSIRHM
jgi:hypothetical protein